MLSITKTKYRVYQNEIFTEIQNSWICIIKDLDSKKCQRFYIGGINTSKIVQFYILTNFENFKNSILGIFDFRNCKNFNFFIKCTKFNLLVNGKLLSKLKIQHELFCKNFENHEFLFETHCRKINAKTACILVLCIRQK